MNDEDNHPIDDRMFFPAMMNLLAQNLAETRALSSMLIVLLSQGDPAQKQLLQELLKTQVMDHKKELMNRLYEMYGYLPPDILGEDV